MLFFTDDVIIMYVANPKESTDKLLQLIKVKRVNLKVAFFKKINIYFYIPGEKRLF